MHVDAKCDRACCITLGRECPPPAWKRPGQPQAFSHHPIAERRDIGFAVLVPEVRLPGSSAKDGGRNHLLQLALAARTWRYNRHHRSDFDDNVRDGLRLRIRQLLHVATSVT